MNSLETDLPLAKIAGALGLAPADIHDIEPMKKGMTNRSFLLTAKGRRYILRIPGEGTDKLISRRQEALNYRAIAPLSISDRVVFLEPDTGCKLTEFVENARVCDPQNPAEVRACIDFLRAFHQSGRTVPHSFDTFGLIERYEGLWQGAPSVFEDYAATKEGVLALRPFIEAQPKQRTLTHIDAVHDNFLLAEEAGSLRIRLIDWEYAAMQDPHLDIAMFALYALYERPAVDGLIDVYFEGACPPATRAKIYCYIAACGLLWSNWCEYKRTLGVEFGDYAIYQYQAAKGYSAVAQRAIDALESPR